MKNIQAKLDEFAFATENPLEAVKKYNTANKPIIGMVPYFMPFSLVEAFDMYPIELWGEDVEISSASKYYPAFYCSVAVTILEAALRGKYDAFSGVIIPTTCDALRNLEENWKFAVPQIPVVDIVQPVNSRTDAGKRYYITQLKRAAQRLEEISGVSLTDKNLRKAIVKNNKKASLIREFNDIALDHLDVITPYMRHVVLRAAGVMPIDTYIDKLEELNKELESMDKYEFDGIKLVVSSIVIDSKELLDCLEDSGIAIVGDDMPSEFKRYEKNITDHIDPFVSLADEWANIEGCSLSFDPYKKRGELLKGLIERTKADGLLVNIIKFCEEEEFDYPILKKEFEQWNIPILYLETENQSDLAQQAVTRIQAFCEALQ